MFIKKYKEMKRQKELQKFNKQKEDEERILMDDFYQNVPEIKRVSEVDRRMFYDVTFEIILSNGCKVLIKRYDSETLKSFTKEILNLKKNILQELDVKNFRSLDERNKIYYD